ncbi:MAG TPA: c-type cytochrome [Saprospiraceae bacterium]|nr:c-type cytochrome [Saprospiraceae bacterium]
MKSVLFASFLLVFLMACGGGASTGDGAKKNPYSTDEKTASGNPSYDPARGEGKWSADNVKLNPTLDAAMAEAGGKVREVKCASCHKLTDEKLVGPGWKGVTSRHKPEWIMNFITNPDPMITKDPKMQAQLEICLVRMPNQNLTDDEARQILEFMRKNDGVQ